MSQQYYLVKNTTDEVSGFESIEPHLNQIFTDLEVLFRSPAHGQTSKCFFWSPGHAVAKCSKTNDNKH